MPSSASSASTPDNGHKSFLAALLIVGAVLVFNFHPSFSSHLTLFSNDGPLGVISSQSDYALSNFRGAWQPLNWIGDKMVGSSPSPTQVLYLLLGAVSFSKYYTPVALSLLGLSAWLLFRQLGFKQPVCVLGGLALALNTDPFSYACWGLASLTLSMAAFVLALAALAWRPARHAWRKTVLTGLAVGLGIMEGFDSGAIFSLYAAAFSLVQSWSEAGTIGQRIRRGIARVALIALVALLTSGHTLSVLVQTQIKGVAGMQQDTKSRQERWNEATQWSLPKLETLRVLIPGLFGYRMDTQGGGNYWGSVGQTPGWEQHRQGYPRHSGAGVYAGVLVVLIAGWAVSQSLRGLKSSYPLAERRFVWFWSVTALISLLLAFGRHAPFYQFFYALPYLSTIRNPVKFMHPFSVALIVLFAYGLQDLARRYLASVSGRPLNLGAHLRQWWSTIQGFDRKWTLASATALGASLLGWLLYASSGKELQTRLSPEFGPDLASAVSRFSCGEVGWFVCFLALSTTLLTIIVSGWFTGPRAKQAAFFLGALLVVDLSRANQPWIVYYDYQEKYASNPVLDILRDKPYEHRVAGRLMPMSGQHLTHEGGPVFGQIYESWLQHHFQFYRIQSLDIIQMPRMPEVDRAFLQNFSPTNAGQLTSIGRLWQLTNTRYVLGMTGFLEMLNQQVDPVLRRFRVHVPFNFVPRSAKLATASLRLEDLSTAVQPDGPFAIFEFTGALPRAQLHSRWQSETNDAAALTLLASPSYDPTQTVLLASSMAGAVPDPATNSPAGNVVITSYHPKSVTLKAEAAKPSILLLNDKYDPDWKVQVDGKLETVLRCNYIMRGVFLQPGIHTVEFRYEPRFGGLYVSLAAIGVGLVLLCIPACSSRFPRPSASQEPRPDQESVM